MSGERPAETQVVRLASPGDEARWNSGDGAEGWRSEGAGRLIR